MVGNIILKFQTLAEQKATGDAIIRLSRSVSQATPGSEWMTFKADPKAWLFANGYKYVGPGAGPNGEIPAAVNIVPVYDTEDTMHVRVPWKGNVYPPPLPEEIINEPPYGQGQARFPILLARYFMRKCR